MGKYGTGTHGAFPVPSFSPATRPTLKYATIYRNLQHLREGQQPYDTGWLWDELKLRD